MNDLNILIEKHIRPLSEEHPDIINMFYGKSGILSKEIFAQRVNLKITQFELAEMLKAEKEVILRLEGGSIDMGDDFYEKVFSVLNLDFNDYRGKYTQE